MIVRYVRLLLSGVLLLSCKDAGVNPVEGPLYLQSGQMTIEQTDYNSYQVVATIVTTTDIEKVEIGTLTGSILDAKTTLAPNVTMSQAGYVVTFSATADFRDTTSREETIRVRLANKSGHGISIDTTLPTYKYPYPSAEIVLTRDNLPTVSFFQDVVFLGDTLFFRPGGPHGLFRYDPVTSTATELFMYPGGDHLAADSGKVFLDDHMWIEPWNSRTGLLEGLIVYYGLGPHIGGMDVSEGLLVVLVSFGGEQFRYRYDYSGNLVDSLRFETQGYYLAIRNGILHRTGWVGPPQIYRYAFSGGQLPSFYAPAKFGDGIKFHDDFLYYCDYSRGFIGRVPVADLREVP